MCTMVNAQLSVFSDSYGAGITFADFGGAINAVTIDNAVAHSGTSSIKAVVPTSSYTGGTFKIATPQNLTAYNSISFWVKADAAKTLNVSGIGDNSPITTYQAEYNALPVSTTWTKYIIPIPAPSKLTAEIGLFHFAEGSDEGPYTLWFDDIKYENSPAIGAFSPAITTQTLTPLVGGNFTPTGQTLNVLVNGVSQTIKVALACFDFMSSNTAVATIVNGTGTAVGAGTAVITGTLNSVAATGTITVNVGAASVPMTAAPTPTRLAANVISVFSNAYTDVAGTDWNPNWGQATVVSDVMIAGNATKKYANLNYQGIGLTPGIDASAMEFVHFDIWTPTALTFDFFLISPGPQEKAFPTSPATGAWVGYDVPLSAFAPPVALNNIFQMKLVGTPSGATVYLDNIYFYKNPPSSVPLVAAPTPTRLASNVISVFSNAYTNVAGTDFNPNWGQTTVVTDVQIAGNDTKKYTNLNYQGITLGSAIDASAMEFVHFDVWTPTPALTFDFFLISPGPQEKAFPTSPATGAWVGYDVPLSAFAPPVALNNIFQMKLVGTPAGGTVYLDNIYFYKNPPTAPLVAAPTPTRLATNVISVFSNAYTNVAGTDFNPNWGQTTVVTDVQIAGNDTKKYTNLNYQGITLGSAIDASAMEFVHFDVWTPTPALTFDFFLISPGPQEKAFPTSPTTGTWASYDVPLSAFAPPVALNNIFQMKLVGTPSGGTVYLDNIYFYKNPSTATVPLVAAPTPTRLATNVISVFSNAYTNVAGTDFNPNWGQSTVVTDVQIAGNDTKKYTNLNYQGITLGSAIDASAMEFVHFDVWTPTPALTFDFFLISPGPQEKAFPTSPTTGTWASYDVPLSAFAPPVALNNIFQMKLVGTPSGGTVYLDNIYFYKNPSTATVPLVAAPTPTRLATNVISVFSNAYTNVAGTDFNPNWGQSTVVTDVQIAGNDTKKYTNLNYQGITLGSAIDASAMEFVHFDVWTPTPALTFDFFLISPGPQEKAFPTSPATGAWIGYDVPLSAFAPPVALNNIFQMKLVGTPSGGTVYLDNIYFYKNPPTAPLTAAPVPTKPAANVISVYSNTYTDLVGTDFFPNWGQSTVVTDILITGNNTKKYDNLNYQGVQFSAPVNASTMETLHFDLWTTNCTAFDLFLINTSPSTIEQKVTVTPTAYGWNSFDIPLSSYNTIALNNIGQFKLVGTPFGSSLVYLDNIYFYNTPTFAASATNLTIASLANSTKTFNITSNTNWTATSNQPWLTVNTAAGVGNAVITLTAQLNPSSTATRTAIVTLAGLGFTTKTVTVVQDISPVALAVSQNSFTVNALGTTPPSFNIVSNTNWVVSSNQSWLVVNPLNGSGNVTATTTAQANTTTSPRTAIVTVSATGVASQTITIVQAAGLPTLALSTANLSVAAPANSSNMFDIVSNTNWTIGTSEIWFTVNQIQGSGNTTITVTATENTSTTPRSAIIAVVATGTTAQTITLNQDGAAPTLAVSSNSLFIASAANSTKTFDVVSNTNWTAVSSQAWLALSSPSGTGNTTMTLTAQANPNATTRTATVTLSSAGLPDQVVTIVQAAVGTLSVSTNTLSIAAPANSTKTFDIVTNSSWTATSSQTWLALNNASGTGNATMTLTAQANPTIATRTATVTVSVAGATSQVVTVTQEAGAATLTVSSATLTIAAPANSTKTFDVVSNTTWTLASNSVWLVPSSTGGTGNATMTLTAAANPLTTVRTATVTISATGAADQIITVTQEVGAAALTVSSNTLTIASPANSTKTFDVISNTTWAVVSNETWLVPNNTSGTGNTTLTLTAAANPLTTVRTATITVSAAGVPDQIITVTQDAAGNVLAVNPNTLTIAAPANSTKTFDVTSNINWTIVSNQTWLSVGTASGTANAPVTLTAAANPNATTRTATVTISGNGVGNQTVIVTQEAAVAVLTVSTNALTVAAPANSTKTFDVTSNTNWTVSSNQAWLAVSKASGSANATITVTAQENTIVATRTATVTISAAGLPDQKITVTQDAAPAVLAVSVTTLSIAAPANSTKTVDVTSNTTWTVKSNATWLTSNIASGTGNTQIILTAAVNISVFTRVGTITVSAAGAPDKIITVTQDAAPIVMTVSTTALNIGSAANSTKTFDITSNTSWTISSDQPSWLAINYTNGLGNAIVTLTAQANNTNAARTAIVTLKAAGVTDKTVTVTQGFVTGIDDLDVKKIDFSVYPNPANDYLFVKLTDVNVDLLKMNITDLQGKTMISLNKTDLQNDVDISALPQGIYFVQLIDAQTKSISTKKFVKL